MRTIEFRGKSVKNDHWHYGDLQTNSENDTWISELDCGEGDNGFFINVKYQTVGQFTGKYDKLKNKIFEGDICEVLYCNHSSPDVKIIQEVIFENGCFILRAKNHLGLELEDSRLYVPLYYSDAPNKIKIIGNIHDNAGLL